MAGRGRGEMDPSACHINILLASDLIIIEQPIYTVRHVMLVNCTKKKKRKNPTACNIKPSNLMPTPLGESLKFSSFCLPSLFFLSWMCLCHKSPASGFPFFPSTSKHHNLYLSEVNGSQSKDMDTFRSHSQVFRYRRFVKAPHLAAHHTLQPLDETQQA